MLRRGHRRRQVATAAGEPLARGEEIDALHRTERARAQQLDRLAVRHERRVLRAHLRDDAVPHGEVAQERRLGVPFRIAAAATIVWLWSGMEMFIESMASPSFASSSRQSR